MACGTGSSESSVDEVTAVPGYSKRAMIANSECKRGQPMRIVSLLPSATEIVCALGLEDQLVGVTHECDYPENVRSLPKITTTLIPTAATSREIDTLVRERLEHQRALYSLDLPTFER